MARIQDGAALVLAGAAAASAFASGGAAGWLALGSGMALLAVLPGRRREVPQPVAPPMAALEAALPGAFYAGTLHADGSMLVCFGGAERTRFAPDASPLDLPGAWRGLMSEGDLATRAAFVHRLRTEGEAEAAYELNLPDGPCAARERARICGAAPDGAMRIAGIITDAAAERRLRAQAEMAARLAALGRMSASLSHEMAQPLSTIGFAADSALVALEAGRADAQAFVAARLAAIRDQAARGRRLVEQLRALARADDGPLEPVELDGAVADALIVAGPALRDGGVRVVRRLDPDLNRVRGRRVLLGQLLVNLLVNARDAMREQPEDTRTVTIRARREAGGAAALLEVEDTGPGLPPGMAERLFEPFVTTKAAGAGSGLGLAICREIVAAAGGTLTAANTGHGARFTARLPAAEPAS